MIFTGRRLRTAPGSGRPRRPLRALPPCAGFVARAADAASSTASLAQASMCWPQTAPRIRRSAAQRSAGCRYSRRKTVPALSHPAAPRATAVISAECHRLAERVSVTGHARCRLESISEITVRVALPPCASGSFPDCRSWRLMLAARCGQLRSLFEDGGATQPTAGFRYRRVCH